MKDKLTGQLIPHPVGPYKETLALYGKRALSGRDPFTGPVGVALQLRMPVPKKYEHDSAAARVAQPDIDNLAKSILDAWTGILWSDDRQVSYLELNRVLVSDFLMDPESRAGPGVRAVIWSIPR